MVNLSTEDRQQLIQLLQALPEFASEASRRQILEYAGLQRLLPMIDVSGPPFLASSQIVNYLASYGRLTYENEALGVFLNAVKTFVGVQQQDYLASLLIKYDMMTPVAPEPGLGTWKGADTPESVAEKIIGENTLRPIAFLSQGVHVARSVAFISVQDGADRWSGTGFMITPDLAITNHHVLPDANVAPGVLFRFNYEENFHGEAQPTREYRAKQGGVFRANEELDYAIVELEGSPGNEWGWLPLRARDLKTRERINIIQHPNGLPKQISMQNNFVEYVGGNVAQYVTSTQPGSSGSPVFNDGWEVVALHHAGGNLQEPTTGKVYFRNEGILVTRVLADLPGDIQQQLSAAQG